MAKVDLDTAERLDITCRKGDTFSLTLTLKDSSGTALPLATDKYKFLMQVRKPSTSRGRGITVPARIPVDTSNQIAAVTSSDTGDIEIGSVELGRKGGVNFSFNDIDDSGNVTVFLSADDMKKVSSGRYVYDLQYVVGDTHKTVLEGRFRINEDVSKSL